MTQKQTRKNNRRRRLNNTVARANANTNSGLVLRSLRQIVPDRLRTTLCYTATTSYSGSPSGGNIFLGNAPYDPEYAVGGDQPVGYDQLSALYTRYRVYASKIRVRFVPTASSAIPIHCAIHPTNTGTSVVTPRLASQLPYAKDIVVMGQNPTVVSLTNQVSTAAIAGEAPQKVQMDDVYSALFNASPLAPWYWSVSVAAVDSSTNVSGNLLVEIWYDTEFYRRIDLSQS